MNTKCRKCGVDLHPGLCGACDKERLMKARDWLEAICDEFERTVAYADWRAAGSKGMSPGQFNGDFASVVQLPSAIERMRWWVRVFKNVLEPKND